MGASFYSYWGKATHDDVGEFHLLPYHCLDVAGVAECILNTQPHLMQSLRRRLATTDDGTVNLVRFFAALHDIGKFSDDFQNLRPDLLKRLRNLTSRARCSIRHDALGLLAWREIAWPTIRESGWLCQDDDDDPYRWRDDVLGTLAGAMAGHHGKPAEPSADGCVARADLHFTAENRVAMKEFTCALISLHSDTETPLLQHGEDLAENARMASWLMAGLLVLADWIESSVLPFSSGCHSVN